MDRRGMRAVDRRAGRFSDRPEPERQREGLDDRDREHYIPGRAGDHGGPVDETEKEGRKIKGAAAGDSRCLSYIPQVL